MKRFIEEKLITWKMQADRKPLLLRGARQVGKTWTILDFGRQHFDRVHRIDLEQRPDWHGVFAQDLVADRILSELEILLNTEIRPGQDLLFFDEIQACPKAIMALRYLYEERPELHVIAAGSLLEFAMRELSFPVGRVQFLSLAPLNFAEFLLALGRKRVAEIILSSPVRLSDSVHASLLQDLRQYLFVGGMPECVLSYAQSRRLREALNIQTNLLAAFRQDFAKYRPRVDPRVLEAVLKSIASNVGHQIKYAALSDQGTPPTAKKAFEVLGFARLFHDVSAANPTGLPLGYSASRHKFKAVFVDVGLMQNLCGLALETEYGKADLLDIYQGALAEQFVGQEMVSTGQEELYYWSREAKGSSAEVDYLSVQGGAICPVEVKSGAAGRLRSLHLFLRTYPQSPKGIVLSMAPYAELPEQKLLFLPLYYAFATGSGWVSLNRNS